MATVTEPLSRNVIYRHLVRMLQDVEAPLLRAFPAGKVGKDDERTRELEDAIAVCLTTPDLLDRLAESAVHWSETGQISNRQATAEALHTLFESWPRLLMKMRQLASFSEQAGHPVEGAPDLEAAAKGIRATRQRLYDSLPWVASVGAPTTLDGLVAEQGAPPAKTFEDLLGDFWPRGESVDEFIAAVQEWRREGEPRGKD